MNAEQRYRIQYMYLDELRRELMATSKMTEFGMGREDRERIQAISTIQEDLCVLRDLHR